MVGHVVRERGLRHDLDAFDAAALGGEPPAGAEGQSLFLAVRSGAWGGAGEPVHAAARLPAGGEYQYERLGVRRALPGATSGPRPPSPDGTSRNLPRQGEEVGRSP